GVRLELVGGDHGTGMDLDDGAEHAELARLGLQGLGLLEQARLVHGRLEPDLVHDRDGRQREVAAHHHRARPAPAAGSRGPPPPPSRPPPRPSPPARPTPPPPPPAPPVRAGPFCPASPAPAFTLRTRGTLSLSGASLSRACFLMTSRRIRSLRRVSRKWAQAV